MQELLYGVQKGILSDDMLKQKERHGFDYKHFFCLFHVTLHTLRYTNEIVVDLSRNSLQALFWLGVAHGRNAQAITVRHTPTLEELKLSGVSELPAERNIFDVAGLWTAILHSNTTDGFYRQLAMTQIGIEQHSKLTLPETETEHDKEMVLDEFFETSPYMKFGYEKLYTRIDTLDKDLSTSAHTQEEKLALFDEMSDMMKHLYSNQRMKAIWKILAKRNRKESERLESYYRTLFWKRMLRYNELQLYTTQRDGYDRNTNEPRRVSITWDVDATSELSHYLSKRTTIGRYRFHALREKTPDPKAREGNFITIGGQTAPMEKEGTNGIALYQHIRDILPPEKLTRQTDDGQKETIERNVIRHLAFFDSNCCTSTPESPNTISFRGFFSKYGTDNAFAQFPNALCTGNLVHEENSTRKEACSSFKATLDPEYRPILKHFSAVEEPITDKFHIPDDKKPACALKQNEQKKYDQLAQLILWRDVPTDSKDQKEIVKYRVSLIGVSGPSTLALTSLLVDDQQKRALFKWPNETEKPAVLPLNTLQTEIRKSLMDHFDGILRKKLDEKSLDLLFGKVSYATKLYLSTVLYRYFFPFLSKADEERICNGMSAFVTSRGFMRLFDEPKHHHPIEEAVTEALRETISSFLGVEVLYTVEVEYGDKGKDDRKPKDIHLLHRDLDKPGDGKGEPMISCLFKDA